MKHIFIVNKISGKGINTKLMEPLKEVLNTLGIDYDIHLTQYPTHAKNIAEEYVDKTDICLYSMGGDGTLYEVLNGMDTRQPLGVIPTGSGNDFFRQFGHDEKTDIKELITKTIVAEPKRIDYGTFDDKRFINCFSIGIDAKINLDASNMIRNTFLDKGTSYIASIVKNVIRPKATRLYLTVDGQRLDGEWLVCAVMNGQYYGNGKHACPQAKLDDGYLDLTLARRCPQYKVYGMLLRYLDGKHLGDPLFDIHKVKDVIIESPNDFYYQADGENYTGKRLHIQIVEKALDIKVASV